MRSSTPSSICRRGQMTLLHVGISLLLAASQGLAQETVSIPIPKTQQQIQADIYSAGQNDNAKRGIVWRMADDSIRPVGESRHRSWPVQGSLYWRSPFEETGRIRMDPRARLVPLRIMQRMYSPGWNISTRRESSGSQRSAAAWVEMRWERRMHDPRQGRSTASCF